MTSSGTLYVVSTPIGNLEDISIRALNTLKEVDFILCEDTRHSIKLLNHFEIKKPLISYHKFNEMASCDYIISRLESGENAALISDAGTPLISDPGSILVQRLIDYNIEFTVVSGANALLPALIMSGFSTENFLFYGFLPKKRSLREKELTRISEYPFVSIIYCSPHELRELLLLIESLLPMRRLSLSKEITKLHETTLRGTATDILSLLPENIKGEFVMVIDKCEEESSKINYCEIDDEALNEMFEEELQLTNDKKLALKNLAKKFDVPKRDLYDRLMKN